MSGLRPCPTPRCAALTKGGHCFEHRRLKDKQRGTARERGYTSAWDRYSKARLKQHPLCVACEQAGRVVPAQVTDHIQAHKGDMSLFWNESNHQSLCFQCNNAKNVSDEGGFGREIGNKFRNSGASGTAGRVENDSYAMGIGNPSRIRRIG